MQYRWEYLTLAAIGIREIAAAVGVLAKGNLARYGVAGGSSQTSKFENELASAMRVDYALAVNSGTSGLISALVGANIGPGDEVLVPAYTWISTAAAPLLVGAIPILVEVDETLTIDVADMERKITARTKAVIPVHMLNLPCDMDPIMEVARLRNLVVIEDACQAIGVKYRGRHLGTIGDAGVFSFNQHKNLKCGEGGAVVTSDERLHVRAKMFHDVGNFIRPDRDRLLEEPAFVGLNFRMPELSSAILRPQLIRLERQIRSRERRRAYVIKKLAGAGFPGRIGAHNDPGSAAGLAVQFDTAEEAIAFARHRGVNRLLDTERHVYTNWKPIVEPRFASACLDPYRLAEREPNRLTPDTCPVTLDILSKTCSLSLDTDIAEPVFRLAVRKMCQTAN